MVKLVRFLTRDYPAIIEYKPPVAKTFQVERRPFEDLSVYANGVLLTGTVADPETGVVVLAATPQSGTILTCRYAPVWFTDAEIQRMAVIEYAEERLYEKSEGVYTFASLKAPLVYEVSIDGAYESDPHYDEETNAFTLTTDSIVLYEGTVCNVYATAAYLYTIMASDPERIRANYASRITDIPAVQAAFREQSERLFKLGGHHFD